MKNVFTITRSTSIPIIAAASRSKDVARIAFPSFVRVTSSQRPAIIATAGGHDDEPDDPDVQRAPADPDLDVDEVEGVVAPEIRAEQQQDASSG